jgi:hypothetical protein
VKHGNLKLPFSRLWQENTPLIRY